jgi:hypothetical protein
MLSDVEAAGRIDIVSWQPHGRAFIVHKPKELVTEIMPLYFKQTKWSSFQRQLNIYGFGRLTCGLDRGCYYHPKFLKGRPDLCEVLIRQNVKGTKVRVPSDASNEPNFYADPPLEPASSQLAGLGSSTAIIPMEQVSSVARLPEHASVGGEASQSVYEAAHPYASHQGIVPIRIDDVPPGAAPPMTISFQGLDRSTWIAAVSSQPTRTYPRPYERFVHFDAAGVEANAPNDSRAGSEGDVSRVSSTSADDLLKIPDNLNYLQDAFASLDKWTISINYRRTRRNGANFSRK